MSQGKLGGSTVGPTSGMSPSGSSPLQNIGSANLPGGVPSPVTSAMFGQTQSQPTIGMMGSSFGQTSSGGDGGIYGPIQPRQSDPALANGSGPLAQSIGPVAPAMPGSGVKEDSLTGLPGPDHSGFGM